MEPQPQQRAAKWRVLILRRKTPEVGQPGLSIQEQTVRKSHEIGDLYGKIDFVIIIIKDEEYVSVLDRFQASDIAEGERRYRIGKMKTIDGQYYSYAIVRGTDQGQTEAQNVAKALIMDFDPSLLLLVGICGAVPSSDFTLGDIVCATRVNDYSVSAATEGKPEEYNIDGGPMHVQIRNLLGDLPQIARTIPKWNTRAAIKLHTPAVEVPEWDPRTKQYSHADKIYGDKRWQELVVESLHRHFPKNNKARQPLATARAVASSSRLIKASLPLKQWRKTARAVAAVEMELAGIYAAARTGGKEYPILAIRSISDVVGFKRRDEWTEFACAVAAAFTFSLVRSGELQKILGPRGETTHRGQARRELEQRGIPFDHPSLYTHIRVANPDIVRLLLTGGLTANVEIAGETPLELCLRTIEDAKDPKFPVDQHRIEVLEAILSAPEPPRDIATTLHQAFEQERPVRLIALLRAGAPAHLADRSGFTLLQKVMAHDEAWRSDHRLMGPWPSLTETVVRASRTLNGDSLRLALLWSARRGDTRVADAILSRGCSADARLDDHPPRWPVMPEELKFFWPGGTALHLAVHSSVQLVSLLLEHHATPGVLNRTGNSPLHEAVTESPSHALEVVPRLLDAVADPNARNFAGSTPLHLLVRENDSRERIEVARLLLQAGAKVDAVDASGRGPLDLCPDKLAFVEQLLDAGAKLTSARSVALLHHAARWKDRSAITSLIQRGIGVNSTDEDGQTALHELARYWGRDGWGYPSKGSQCWIERSRACLEELLQGRIDVGAPDRYGRTALHLIAGHGDEEAMKSILDAGADANARSHSDTTPLMLCRTAASVRMLIAHRADPKGSRSSGYSVYDLLSLWGEEEAAKALAEVVPYVKLGPRARLSLALRRRDRGEVRMLLQNGADPNSIDENGQPILFTAIQAGDPTIVSGLLDCSASAQAEDPRGYLAIHAAVEAGCIATVELLLDRGAELEARTQAGWTPLGVALVAADRSSSNNADGRHERMVSALLDHEASVLDVDGEGNPAAFRGVNWWWFGALARRLMAACLRERDANGDTLLHAAAYVGRHEEFRWIIDGGLDPNIQNAMGQSPLHKLLSRLYTDSELATGVAALVGAGARADVSDCSGCTPLHLAVRQKSLPSVETLLKHGANPNAKDNTGLTPIDEALRAGDVNILQALLNIAEHAK